MTSDVGVIIGCGPSLTPEQIEMTRHLPQFGANRAFQFDIDVVLGCNWEFWDHYWPQIKDMRCDKWTTHPTLKEKRPEGLRWIEGRWEPGLSTDPDYICYHHGSGPQILNLAFVRYNIRRFILIGFDMRYPGKVTQSRYTGKRHFFGEDALTQRHFPRTGPDGELTGLIDEMATIKPDAYGIEIYNCTLGSAMTCFPMMPLEQALEITAS